MKSVILGLWDFCSGVVSRMSYQKKRFKKAYLALTWNEFGCIIRTKPVIVGETSSGRSERRQLAQCRTKGHMVLVRLFRALSYFGTSISVWWISQRKLKHTIGRARFVGPKGSTPTSVLPKQSQVLVSLCVRKVADKGPTQVGPFIVGLSYLLLYGINRTW